MEIMDTFIFTELPCRHFKAMYHDVVFAVPNGSVLENSLLSDLSLYSMDSGLNVTNTSAEDSKINVKKLKYKNTKEKTPFIMKMVRRYNSINSKLKPKKLRCNKCLIRYCL